MITATRKTWLQRVMAVTVLATIGLGLTACTSDDYDKRKESNTQVLKNSLEEKNLKEKLDRENKPDVVRYVYLMNFGQVVGYYVIKGKVSNSSSQLGPEDDIICRYSGDSCQAVDGPQDDGTYGAGDDGVFFFLSDGTMVETTLDYIQSDQPLQIDTPRLGG